MGVGEVGVWELEKSCDQSNQGERLERRNRSLILPPPPTQGIAQVAERRARWPAAAGSKQPEILPGYTLPPVRRRAVKVQPGSGEAIEEPIQGGIELFRRLVLTTGDLTTQLGHPLDTKLAATGHCCHVVWL